MYSCTCMQARISRAGPIRAYSWCVEGSTVDEQESEGDWSEEEEEESPSEGDWSEEAS